MGTRAEKAGCGAPLCGLVRERAGHGQIFTCVVRFTVSWRHGRASGLERFSPALAARRRCVRQRLAAGPASDAAQTRAISPCVDDGLRAQWPRRTESDCRAGGGPAGIQRTAGGAAIGERRGTALATRSAHSLTRRRRRAVSAAMRLCGGMDGGERREVRVDYPRVGA
ncbi:hypothetical protein P171DRAFT_269229 [Karstenula rhodostoma CBS 690.94]|uniref:Uncharacterized protein n=1 Tax=Karstenula rhodostoma CBS 690.94 TaxID=1392251 RepID=A0A9P4PKF1_9PLEO|nr:hypothetical protein P171DRAFT_269229 [Karstenula rhodostoma CBS 690.94]